jgi:hypothetical protein
MQMRRRRAGERLAAQLLIASLNPFPQRGWRAEIAVD